MSETKDGLIYEIYDFTKSVYLFSHMKTNLVDIYVQKGETFALWILKIITYLIFILLLTKIIIIIGYFLIFQATFAFCKFIKLLFLTKCNIHLNTSLKNAGYFFARIFKKIITFNFYIFTNKIISSYMIIVFIITIISNFIFNNNNLQQIQKAEKDNLLINFYILSFEFNLLIELICYIFYSNRNIMFGAILSICYFLVLNIIIIFTFLFAQRYEYLEGAFIKEEPQRILNIIIFFILMVMKIDCLIKIFKYNKESK